MVAVMGMVVVVVPSWSVVVDSWGGLKAMSMRVQR